MPLRSLSKAAEADFPTRWGHFRILGFEAVLTEAPPCREHPRSTPAREEMVALVMGAPEGPPPLVRVHSRCLTGDTFGSLRCDCGPQLHMALARIADEGRGILLYDGQEGRGIGLMAKLRAYQLQDDGLDTVEANEQLGYAADCREFEMAAAVLKQLGIGAVRLMTNNPSKVEALEQAGIRVAERVPAEVPANEHFERYLRTKHDKMGHIFEALAD